VSGAAGKRLLQPDRQILGQGQTGFHLDERQPAVRSEDRTEMSGRTCDHDNWIRP